MTESRPQVGLLALQALGSMGLKVAAACRFVEAAIGALEDAARIVAGTAGTIVVPDASG